MTVRDDAKLVFAEQGGDNGRELLVNMVPRIGGSPGRVPTEGIMACLERNRNYDSGAILEEARGGWGLVWVVVIRVDNPTQMEEA